MTDVRSLACALFLGLAGTTSCGAAAPTHYYQLSYPEFPPASRTAVVLTVRDLVTDGAYREDRIAYRTSPERLDYYYYHRWPTEPGQLLGDYLRRAYARSGRFSAVTADQTPATTLVLDGQLMAFDEVDRSRQTWFGEVELELHLVDGQSGKLLWARHFREEEPLPERSPAGLAQALSLIMGRIARATAPQIAALGQPARVRQTTP